MYYIPTVAQANYNHYVCWSMDMDLHMVEVDAALAMLCRDVRWPFLCSMGLGTGWFLHLGGGASPEETRYLFCHFSHFLHAKQKGGGSYCQ